MQQNQRKEPIEVLKRYWGYESFRPVQEEIIQSVLNGDDTLALLPTGGGKSICFQVPALCLEGLCIVISPLIALMKDQVENLRKRGVSAVAIHSGMPYPEIDRLLDNCAYGDVKLLYLSPERLHTELFKERLKKMPVSMIAVDEAHCISQWGYDFRPAYLEIASIREDLPNVPIIALTATATPEVCTDIQDKLEFKSGQVFQKSFARDNLAYVVRPSEAKPEELVNILKKVGGSAVVYVRNRRLTKELALLLHRKGIRADYYHAGLEMDKRNQKQEAWLKNKIRVIVSTNAFGMGIDKPDVRLVIHWEMPDSLEGYFQEAGRAGRDGKKAFAVLLYHNSDALKLEKQYELSYPDLKEVRRVYRALGSYYQIAVGAGYGESFDFNLIEFSKTYQFEPIIAFNCLKLLEKEGWIILSDAVYNPASLKVLVNQDQLYDFMLKHPKLDKVLKIILRSYQGAFNHHIHIREQSIAGFLRVERSELQKSLNLLHKEQIIDYRPQNEEPQLFFVNGRMDAATVAFDHTGYNFRKEQQRIRIEKAIHYAETEDCRSRLLLAYFGETEATACGHCDYCLAQKKERKLNQKDYQRYRDKLELVLLREALPMEDILASFSPKKKEIVLQTLEYLLDEGQIRQKEERFEWQK
ncbi:MAG TPA: ATP-dependent DNA helicase RecQ [Saprospiraceae bacterium]|nr:ATP-dependent DNA helicase RecQ [Saprospiraceae bacterium]